MKPTKLINECCEAMVDAINAECDYYGAEDATSATATVNTDAGFIDLYMHKNGDKSAVVMHDNESENECPLLSKAIEDGLPDWSDTVEQWETDNPYEDEYQAHGFRDAADYYGWRYGS